MRGLTLRHQPCLRSLRKGSPSLMERPLSVVTSKGNSSARVVLPSAMSSLVRRPGPSLLQKWSWRPHSLNLVPSRSSWARLKFTDLLSTNMSFSSNTFLRIPITSISSWSCAKIRVSTNFWGGERDYTSLKFNVIRCKSSMLLSISTLTELFIAT